MSAKNLLIEKMDKIFDPPNAITSCDKHKISDAWKTNTAFVATTYDTDWARKWTDCAAESKLCSFSGFEQMLLNF